MALEFEHFIPMLSGGAGGVLISTFSKVFMRREDRAEQRERDERNERQMLMTTIMTQSENLGYMKSEVDTLKNELVEVKRHRDECREDMASLRKELGLDRESTRPPA